MKSRPDPSRVPQTEGHPEPFPEVTTLPKGWDLSGLAADHATAMDEKTGIVGPFENAIRLKLDSSAVVEDGLA